MTITSKNYFISDDESCSYDEESPSLGHHMIAKLESHHPDRVLFIDHASGRTWNGKNLKNIILNVAASLLIQYQLEQGSVVTISYDHSDSAIILALAVICAGGTVACAYPKDPYAELLYLARKAQPKLIFCHQKNLAWAEQISKDLGYSVKGVAIDGQEFQDMIEFDRSDLSNTKGLQLPVACKDKSTDVAFILMSSGTTGKPKAIATTHLNCLAELVNARSIGPGEEFTFALIASLDYVSGRLLVNFTIESGLKAIIMNGFEPEEYMNAVEMYKIHAVYLGAASFYKFITHKNLDKYDISSITQIFPMGAKILYLDELRNFFKKYPHVTKAVQGYGTTETSGVSGRDFTTEEYLVNCDCCGKIKANMEIKVVDSSTGKLLGANQQGLIRVRGPQVFIGYYDKDRIKDKPDESPIINDSTVFDEDGFYCTGDIGYFSEKEELYIIGREKELLSCRGALKVLPHALEEVLSQHPAVSKSCVLGIANKLEPTLHCPRGFVMLKKQYRTQDKIVLTERIESHLANRQDHQSLEHRGEHKLCSLPREKRHRIAEDIMEFMNERIGWEKQLTGGLIILDDMPTMKSTGKVDKTYLRSLGFDQIEIYGDQSG